MIFFTATVGKTLPIQPKQHTISALENLSEWLPSANTGLRRNPRLKINPAPGMIKSSLATGCYTGRFQAHNLDSGGAMQSCAILLDLI